MFKQCWIALVLSCSTIHLQGFATGNIVVNGSTGVAPLVKSLAATYQEMNQNTYIQVDSGLNPQARIEALIDGKIDMAMASHGIDIQRISQHGLKVHRIAKVAVVIGVNHSVNVNSISSNQLCDIYGGKIVNWQSLGGSAISVNPFIRPFSEVDAEVVSSHVPCFAQLQFSPQVQIKEKSGQMAKAIANTPGAIGMTTLVRVAQSNHKIIALALNGFEPDTANLHSGDYPLSRDLFLITASQPPAEVSLFLHFIRSDFGAEIIRSNSAIPAK